MALLRPVRPVTSTLKLSKWAMKKLNTWLQTTTIFTSFARFTSHLSWRERVPYRAVNKFHPTYILTSFPSLVVVLFRNR